MINLLIRAIINDVNAQPLLVLYRERLDFALSPLRDEDYSELLWTLLRFSEKYGKCPENLDSLKHYVETNPDHIQRLNQAHAALGPDFENLAGDTEELPTDVEMLMRNLYQHAREVYHNKTYANAAKLSMGQLTRKDRETKEEISGIEVAKNYIRERWEGDLENGPAGWGGGLAEHADDISRMLDEKLENPDKHRIYTGFHHIDDNILIGPQENAWIGILGYTNHGKSSVLLSMLYNMMCHGKNILFIPREGGGAEKAWFKLAFMHSHFFPEMPFCSYDTWTMRPKLVKQHPEWIETKNFLLDTIKNRNGIAGGIDVQKFSTWSEITNHLEANYDKWKYDVLAIDYIGHLDTSDIKGVRDPVEARKQVFRKAQMLSQGFREKGIVVISPLQANKDGMKKANEREGDDQGVYESLAAVDWYTQAAQDMDCVISVWHDANNQLQNTMKLSCLKAKGHFFPPNVVDVDPRTRYVGDPRARERNIEMELEALR